MYVNREAAGRRLAEELSRFENSPHTLLLALPRGGIPVAAAVARRLNLPLDVLVVKKLGFPGQEEFAIGAVGPDGVYLDRQVIESYRIPESYLEEAIQRRQREAREAYERFRRGRPPLELKGKNVILIDDGIATGATMKMALNLVRREQPARCIVATPVAPPDTVAALREVADEVVCPLQPEYFGAIGRFYVDFTQVDEAEARNLLDGVDAAVSPEEAIDPRNVELELEDATLQGILTLPAGPRGLVLFAHGSGSGRFSPRNQYVSSVLARAGFATLLMDLLTEREEVEDLRTARLRFDIGLLAERLAGAGAWAARSADTRDLPQGYFGASTGAAAALVAAARHPERVRAVVSRGGRPDLAGEALAHVRAPTLLIVGGLDDAVLTLNQEARSQLRVTHQLAVVPGASHLFEEPGALEQVAQLAVEWFSRYVPQAEPAETGN